MSRYSSGPSRNWVKTKGPGWKRINERWSIFEATSKSELTEAQKTLARKRFPPVPSPSPLTPAAETV